MGQSLNSMNHQQNQKVSKEELVYQFVGTGDVDAIRALSQQGASLEWIDKEGKTPLIVACMDSGLINVAKTLIELGANINAYRPGRHGGTPLHHATKRGLEQTVRLLLFYGANPFVRNDDCHTPLGIARLKGHTCVVRAIESQFCYFSGWLREFYGPGFLEALAPQLMSRKIWAVVIPCGPANPMKPPRFELAIYSNLQDFQPCVVIALSRAKVDEPKFHLPDPALIIFDHSTKIRYKLASNVEGDKQQLQWLYNACRGISQVMPFTAPHNATMSTPASAHPIATEASGSTIANSIQNAEAISANGWGCSTSTGTHDGWGANTTIMSIPASTHPIATEASGSIIANSIQNAKAISANGWGSSTSADTWGADKHTEASYNGWNDKPTKEDYNGWGTDKHTEATCNGWMDKPTKEDYNGWGTDKHTESSSNGWMDEPAKEDYGGWGADNSGPISKQNQGVQTLSNPASVSAPVSTAPSAPPIPEEESGEGPIRYPSVENSLVDLHVPVVEFGASAISNEKDEETSSSCVICWEAPIEGACVPCGHMAGCISCLREIEAKKGLCPVCRTQINQVIRLYAVC